ncbi:hypothetical protein G2W53_013576 [Senna tora]|uniref:RNase H type-1 domain-containing protein n=1 Tax=Senna tora TaxID=362788 RepID=A0A834WRB2_9FABA|nr:hypothetical protein G2W53_013576 [Senna tora]
MRRGFASTDTCKRCSQHSETSLHTIQDSPHVARLWKNLVDPNLVDRFFNVNLQDWISLNLSKNISQKDDSNWDSKFGICMLANLEATKPMAHDKIMAESQRMRKGFASTDTCKRCSQHSETSLHTIQDSPYVARLWKNLVDPYLVDRTLARRMIPIGTPNLAFACWLIWKQRNQWVFNDKREDAISLSPMIDIQWKDFLTTQRINAPGNKLESHNSMKDYLRQAPSNDWIKINVNGSCRATNQEMSCWLYGFTKTLGKGCSTYAEIWSIYFSLITAWDKGYRKVIFVSDSRTVLNPIQVDFNKPHPLRRLIFSIRELIDKN